VATRTIIERLSKKNERKIYKDRRYSIRFETFSVELFFYPVLKCSYSWNGIRPVVWLNGKSNQVFSFLFLSLNTSPIKGLYLRLNQDRKICFLFFFFLHPIFSLLIIRLNPLQCQKMCHVDSFFFFFVFQILFRRLTTTMVGVYNRKSQSFSSETRDSNRRGASCWISSRFRTQCH